VFFSSEQRPCSSLVISLFFFFFPMGTPLLNCFLERPMNGLPLTPFSPRILPPKFDFSSSDAALLCIRASRLDLNLFSYLVISISLMDAGVQPLKLPRVYGHIISLFPSKIFFLRFHLFFFPRLNFPTFSRWGRLLYAFEQRVVSFIPRSECWMTFPLDSFPFDLPPYHVYVGTFLLCCYPFPKVLRFCYGPPLCLSLSFVSFLLLFSFPLHPFF